MIELARWLSPLPLALAAACATPADSEVVPASSDWPGLDLDDWSIPEELEPGFGSPAREASGLELFKKGDRLLFAIEVRDGKERERWLLELGVTSGIAVEAQKNDGELSFQVPSISVSYTFTRDGRKVEVSLKSNLYQARIRLFDGNGTFLGESKVRVPHFISEGVLEAIERMDELVELAEQEGHVLTREEVLPVGRALMTIDSVFHIVDEDGLVRPILMRAVNPPSVLSMVANLGVELGYTVDLEQIAAVDVPPPYLPARASFYAVPMQVSANGEVALDLELLVTDPGAPLLPCGGMVGLVGRSPTREDLRVEMSLVGARCAPEVDGGETAEEP